MQTPTSLGCIPSQEMQLLKQHQLRHWVTLTKAEAEIASSQTCSSPPNTSTFGHTGSSKLPHPSLFRWNSVLIVNSVP